MKSAPCYQCEDRVPKCHCTCEKYKEYSAERKRINEAKAKYSEDRNILFDCKRKLRNNSYGRK